MNFFVVFLCALCFMYFELVLCLTIVLVNWHSNT